MDNKETLIKLVDFYSIYTEKQRRVLKCLLQVELDNKAKIDVQTLSKKAGMSTAGIYKALALFEKDNLLQILPSSNNKKNNFLFKKAGLEELQKVTENLIK